jgi:hypothetical protein
MRLQVVPLVVFASGTIDRGVRSGDVASFGKGGAKRAELKIE